MQEMTMPLAIVMPEIGNIPSVIYHDEAIDSLKQFRTFSEAPELKDIQAAKYWLALMPDPSGWCDDHSVAKTILNNMKKTGDTTIEEIKTRENVWGSANLDLFMRWVSATMTIPFRNCVFW